MRTASRIVAAAVVLVATTVITACSSAPDPAAMADTCGTTPAQRIAAAQAEGGLNLMGTEPTWANYGAIIDAFEARYGIPVTLRHPSLSSADELTIARTWQGDPRYADVIEVTPLIMDTALAEGLTAPYVASGTDRIATSFSTEVGAPDLIYGGFINFIVNRAKVAEAPTTWAELRGPKFRNGIARLDPRASGTAFAAVIAAALANGGSYDDIRPGIEYFADLQRIGNLRKDKPTENDLRYGTIPVLFDWGFNVSALQQRYQDSARDYVAVAPTDGRYFGQYENGVLAKAPHPCAARLWSDFMLSDEVGLLRAGVGSVPSTYDDMITRGLLSASGSDLLPSQAEVTEITLPTHDQLIRMQEQVSELWGPLVEGSP